MVEEEEEENAIAMGIADAATTAAEVVATDLRIDAISLLLQPLRLFISDPQPDKSPTFNYHFYFYLIIIFIFEKQNK